MSRACCENVDLWSRLRLVCQEIIGRDLAEETERQKNITKSTDCDI